ncbi:MAG: polysaccharide biosynthesis C-terminal domain-containing protein [Chloroflexi bacterium]|nr:polysaccharide biosynthesis C-terminal domain-containing protein [Chloroflexota bacterium]
MGFQKDLFVTFGSRIISTLLGVGVASASAWLLGPEGRGELAVYVVFGTLLALATSGGVEMAGAYHAGIKKYRLPEVVAAEFFIIAVSTALSVGAAYVLWMYPPKFMEKITHTGLVFSLCYIPTMLAYTSFWYLHTALGHTRIYCLGNILNMGFTLIGILTLCWGNGLAERAMLAHAISCMATSSFLLGALVKRCGITGLKLSFGCVKELYVYGVKYYFARLAQFLNVQIGTMVIVFVGSTAAVGYFSSAMGLVSRLYILSEVLCAVLLSRVVSQQEQSLKLASQSYRMTFWLVLGAGCLLGILAKPLVIIVLSPKFLPVLVPVWILLPGVLIRNCSRVLVTYLNGVGRPEVGSIGIISAVITNVVLMFFLLPLLGVTGAAIAATCGYLVDALVVLSFFKFSLGQPLLQLVPQTSDVAKIFSILRKQSSVLRQ